MSVSLTEACNGLAQQRNDIRPRIQIHPQYSVPTYCFNECIFTIKFIEIIKQKITRGIIHNTVMGTNSHTNTHTQTDNEHIFSFHFERSEPRPCTNLALPLIYCASNAVNNEKKIPKSHTGAFIPRTFEHSNPSKLQFILRDFPRVLVYGCGHLQKHTQFSFHVFSVAVTSLPYIGEICKYNCAIDSFTSK